MSAQGTARAGDAELARGLAEIVGDAHVHRVAPGAEGATGAGGAAGPRIDDGAPPAWLVAPGSAVEIAELLGFAHRHEIAVVPVGRGARAPRAAALADRRCLFVRVDRLSHVLRLDETSLVAHVQAGLTGLGLEKVLAPRRLSLGDYSPAVLRSSIGGLLAVRTPGKSSPRHGFIEDSVLGLSAVLADGRTIHTRMAPRRSTGPDLARALCGSEGTLGFITSVYLRIHRRPEARFLAAHALPDVDAALAAVHLALRDEAAPASIEVYDSAEARVHLGADVMRGGEAVLVVATAGPTELAVCDRDLVAGAAGALGGRPLDEQVAQTWWRRRLGREPGAPPPRPSMQVTASPSKQRAVYHAVCAAVRAQGADARAHVSRFDVDGAVLFFTLIQPSGQPAGEPGNGAPLPEPALERLRRTAEDAAAAAGAVLLGTLNASMAPYLAELRRALDPRGIMNPGALSENAPESSPEGAMDSSIGSSTGGSIASSPDSQVDDRPDFVSPGEDA
jgi:alkyldihydroxyacetonephosphate synthase